MRILFKNLSLRTRHDMIKLTSSYRVFTFIPCITIFAIWEHVVLARGVVVFPFHMTINPIASASGEYVPSPMTGRARGATWCWRCLRWAVWPARSMRRALCGASSTAPWPARADRAWVDRRRLPPAFGAPAECPPCASPRRWDESPRLRESGARVITSATPTTGGGGRGHATQGELRRGGSPCSAASTEGPICPTPTPSA